MFIHANAMLDAKVVDFLTAKVIENTEQLIHSNPCYYLDIYTV